MIEEVIGDVKEKSKDYSWFAWEMSRYAKAFGMSYERAKLCFNDIEQGSDGSCLAFQVPPINTSVWGEAKFTVYIKGLPTQMREGEIIETFKVFGQIAQF